MFENHGGGFALFVNDLPEMKQDPFLGRERLGIVKAFLGDSDELIRANARRLRDRNMLFPFIGVALMGCHLQDEKFLVVVGKGQLLENRIGEVNDLNEGPSAITQHPEDIHDRRQAVELLPYRLRQLREIRVGNLQLRAELFVGGVVSGHVQVPFYCGRGYPTLFPKKDRHEAVYHSTTRVLREILHWAA
jgi:hypothetical protein